MARSRLIVVKTTVALKLNSLVRPRHQRRLRGFELCCRGAAVGGRLGCSQVNKLQVSLPSCDDRQQPRARAAFCVRSSGIKEGCHLVRSGTESVHGTRLCRAGWGPASTRFLESVVRLITWRPRCSEEAAVPVSGQSAVEELLEV